MNGDIDLHGVYQNVSYRLTNIKINEAITDIKIIIPFNFRVYVHYYNKNVGYCFRAVDTVADVKKQIELGVSYIPTNVIKPNQIVDNQ